MSNTKPTLSRTGFDTEKEARTWARRKSKQVPDKEFVVYYDSGKYAVCPRSDLREKPVQQYIQSRNIFWEGESNQELDWKYAVEDLDRIFDKQWTKEDLK